MANVYLQRVKVNTSIQRNPSVSSGRKGCSARNILLYKCFLYKIIKRQF